MCSLKDHWGQYNAYENVWYNRYFYYVTSLMLWEGKWRPEPWNNGEKKKGAFYYATMITSERHSLGKPCSWNFHLKFLMLFFFRNLKRKKKWKGNIDFFKKMQKLREMCRKGKLVSHLSNISQKNPVSKLEKG